MKNTFNNFPVESEKLRKKQNYCIWAGEMGSSVGKRACFVGLSTAELTEKPGLHHESNPSAPMVRWERHAGDSPKAHEPLSGLWNRKIIKEAALGKKCRAVTTAVFSPPHAHYGTHARSSELHDKSPNIA